MTLLAVHVEWQVVLNLFNVCAALEVTAISHPISSRQSPIDAARRPGGKYLAPELATKLPEWYTSEA